MKTLFTLLVIFLLTPDIDSAPTPPKHKMNSRDSGVAIKVCGTKIVRLRYMLCESSVEEERGIVPPAPETPHMWTWPERNPERAKLCCEEYCTAEEFIKKMC